MKRHDLTRASLMVSLAYMSLPGNCYVGSEPFQASSSRSPEAESAHIVDGSTVTLQYTASVPGLTGIEYDEVREFIRGRHESIPALEREVVGMKHGEEKRIELSPGESFGSYDVGEKLTVPKPTLPAGTKKGNVLRNDAGELATVAEVGDLMAMLEYNHPLAGKQLVVQLKILKVENP